MILEIYWPDIFSSAKLLMHGNLSVRYIERYNNTKLNLYFSLILVDLFLRLNILAIPSFTFLSPVFVSKPKCFQDFSTHWFAFDGYQARWRLFVAQFDLFLLPLWV